MQPAAEVSGPRWEERAQCGEFTQIVRGATGGEDQHTFFAQGCRRTAQVEMVTRAQLPLQGDLQHRYISPWIHQHQRYPRAVIQTPLRI